MSDELQAELDTLKAIVEQAWKVRDQLQRLAKAAADDARDFPARSGNGVYADSYQHAVDLLSLALNAEPPEHDGGDSEVVRLRESLEQMRWRLDQAVQGRDRAQLRVRDLQDALTRIEALADDYETQVRELEADHGGPIPWTDTITVVVAKIREAVAGPTPPKGWIRDPDGDQSNFAARSSVSAVSEATGGATGDQEAADG